jgi:hypothetical protein
MTICISVWSMSRMVSSCIITYPVVFLAVDRRVVYVGSLVQCINIDRTSRFERPMVIHGMGLAAQQVLVPL